MKQYLDINTWNRKTIFESYQGTDLPYVILGYDLDITRFYDFVKDNRLSLYFSLLYVTEKAADEIENYRYRFDEKGPYVIERNTVFCTHIPKGCEIFQMVEMDHYDNIIEYAARNRKKADIVLDGNGLSQMAGRDDILNCTCIPWTRYTTFIRTIGKIGMDCNPKISFGKYEKENGRVIIPFSSQTHHGLTDGYHVGKFFERFEEIMRSITE